MARKVKDAKAPEIKEPVKAAPVEVSKEPAKSKVKAEPKKAAKKTAAKKATPAKAKEEAKAVAAPVEEVKAPVKAEKKESPKKAGRKPVAKKTVPTKAAKVLTTSVLQVSGSEFDFDKVVKAVEGLKKKNAGKSLEIYIKPEDRAIYYVVNGNGGKKIDL